jgi:uncharacterized membrane protein YwzB
MPESYIQLPPDSTGKKVRTFYDNVKDVHEEFQLSKPVEYLNPIYVVAVGASAVAASKHHISIWNGSTYRIRILAISVSMHTTATVTGFVMQYLAYRASAISGGTALAVDRLDPDDPALPSGITATTGATVTVTGVPLAIFTINPEDAGGDAWIYFVPPKPIIIKPNTGFTIQQYGTAGVGLFNAVIYFSVELIKP